MLSQVTSLFSTEEVSNIKYWNACGNIFFRSLLIVKLILKKILSCDYDEDWGNDLTSESSIQWKEILVNST